MVELRSTVPHLATWDDNDYGKNDAGADLCWPGSLYQVPLGLTRLCLAEVGLV